MSQPNGGLSVKRVFIFDDGSRKTYEATDLVLIAADKGPRAVPSPAPRKTGHTWSAKSISVDKGDYVSFEHGFKKVIDIKLTT
jgi:hypothetical protein